MTPARRQVLFAFVALALVMALGCWFNAGGIFFDRATHTQTLWFLSGYAILACGMTVVIITGGIDLSVGSVVALVGVVFAALVMKKDLPGWQAVPLSLLAGAGAGLVSGVLVGVCGMQSFIATLAMMAFARGLAKYICQELVDGAKITRYPTPAVMEAINRRFELGETTIALGVLVLLVCAALTYFLLRFTTFGLRVYAVGDSEEAARVAGVPVRRTKVLAYTYCGLMAGIAGVLFGAMERQGNPDAGVGYELTAIAMVVIGGTSLAGGRGGVLLTLLGALTIGYLRKILDLNSIETPMQLMITGAIIVLAVLVRGVPGRRRGA